MAYLDAEDVLHRMRQNLRDVVAVQDSVHTYTGNNHNEDDQKREQQSKVLANT